MKQAWKSAAVLCALAGLGLAARGWASVFPLPADGSSVVGSDESMQTVYEDTLPDIAHRYSLGYYEIIRANPGVDVWLPGAGTRLVLPGRRILPAGPRAGLVVNLPEHRLYYYPKPRKGEQPVVITYPVRMAGTHGCIRMYPEDVGALFALVPVGTPVRLVNEPVKVAWVEGQLLLEAHPPVDAEGQSIEPDVQLLSQMLDRALGSNTAAIHWDLARATLEAASGIPTLVGLAADPEAVPASAPQAASVSSQTTP